jgi:hypothetical protein
MPEISHFLGIVIMMYFNDHNPPHFHAKYNQYRVAISISNLSILEGSLPPRILGLVMEWADLHKEELMRNWDTLQATGNYNKIEPLI